MNGSAESRTPARGGVGEAADPLRETRSLHAGGRPRWPGETLERLGHAAAVGLRAHEGALSQDPAQVPARVLQRWLRAAIEALPDGDPRRAALETEWRFQQLFRFEDLPTVVLEPVALAADADPRRDGPFPSRDALDRLGEDAASGPARRAPRALWIAEQLLDLAWSFETAPQESPSAEPSRLELCSASARAWLRGFHAVVPLTAIERGALPVLVRSVAALRMLGEREPLGLARPAGFERQPDALSLAPSDLARLAQTAPRLTRCWPA